MDYSKKFFELLSEKFENNISYRYKLLFVKNEKYNQYSVNLAIDTDNNGNKNKIAYFTYKDFEKLDKKLYYFKEDSESYKRKKFKYRIDEMRIRWNGYKAMDVEVWNYIYVLKPLFVGLLPKFFIMKYHRRKYMLNDKNK